MILLGFAIIFGKKHFLLISENEFFHQIKCDGITSFMGFMITDELMKYIFVDHNEFIAVPELTEVIINITSFRGKPNFLIKVSSLCFPILSYSTTCFHQSELFD